VDFADSVSRCRTLYNLGNLAVTVGDTTTADQHYRAALAIAERLATADPGNATYQRDLSISQGKVTGLENG
jgi:hypothetical protein